MYHLVCAAWEICTESVGLPKVPICRDRERLRAGVLGQLAAVRLSDEARCDTSTKGTVPEVPVGDARECHRPGDRGKL